MLYTIQSSAPGEKIVHVGRFHPIYTIAAISNIVFGVIFMGLIYAGAIYTQIKTGANLGAPITQGESWFQVILGLRWPIHMVALGLLAVGVLKFTHMLLVRASTEIAVTTERVVYKSGVIARYVGEMNIERIEGVNVFQSILGRLFNFGSVVIHGMGVGQIILPAVMVDPVKFRRAVEYAHTLKEGH